MNSYMSDDGVENSICAVWRKSSARSHAGVGGDSRRTCGLDNILRLLLLLVSHMLLLQMMRLLRVMLLLLLLCVHVLMRRMMRVRKLMRFNVMMRRLLLLRRRYLAKTCACI